MKAPAAVSLACLAATLLIAAQGFRGHPTTKHSNLPAQHTTDNLRTEEAISELSSCSKGVNFQENSTKTYQEFVHNCCKAMQQACSRSASLSDLLREFCCCWQRPILADGKIWFKLSPVSPCRPNRGLIFCAASI